MDSKTHLGNGLINQQLLLFNTDTITNITIKLKTLEIMASMHQFMDLLQQTKVFSQNHGEDQKQLTQLTDSRTHLSNG
jgi:hypothetical protein